tara:strand:+ start:213 stop:476 length:264 start_codon:yes stop_codon:yes gene_type:complete
MEVYKFSAPWCGPCKFYKSVFDEVLSLYKDIEVIEVDIDEQKDLVKKYSIRAIPTTVFTKNGVELHTSVGINENKELTELIEKYKDI